MKKAIIYFLVFGVLTFAGFHWKHFIRNTEVLTCTRAPEKVEVNKKFKTEKK